jgi:hypothetical protein
MKVSKSNREIEIENLVNSIETQEQYEKKINRKLELFFSKYKEELEDYMYIKNENEYNNLKKGGYIRYIDFNENLRWGGILLKKYDFNSINMMLLCNSSAKTFKISFENNYIFYKKHTTQSDKTRKLFLSYLDKV